MNTKKILIGAGVGAFLAWGWWMYSKKKGQTLVSDSMDDSQKMSNEEFPVGEPIGNTVADTPMKTPELEVHEELPNGTVEETIETTMPIAQTRPMPVTEPLTQTAQKPVVQSIPLPQSKPMVQTATIQSLMATKPTVLTATRTVSRFSGFDGGGNHIEVGSDLTDLN